MEKANARQFFIGESSLWVESEAFCVFWGLADHGEVSGRKTERCVMLLLMDEEREELSTLQIRELHTRKLPILAISGFSRDFNEHASYIPSTLVAENHHTLYLAVRL